jgi:hypothetical protein
MIKSSNNNFNKLEKIAKIVAFILFAILVSLICYIIYLSFKNSKFYQEEINNDKINNQYQEINNVPSSHNINKDFQKEIINNIKLSYPEAKINISNNFIIIENYYHKTQFPQELVIINLENHKEIRKIKISK